MPSHELTGIIPFEFAITISIMFIIIYKKKEVMLC